MEYRKDLCNSCNLDGECCCQKSQKGVDKCGMESVLRTTEKYNKLLNSGRLTRGGAYEDRS